jgi:hypothetical protein
MQMNPAHKTHLTRLAELAGLVALAATIAFLPIDVANRVLAEVVLVLMAALVVLSYESNKRADEVRVARNEIRLLEDTLRDAQPFSRLADDTLALAYYMSQGPTNDPDHRYNEISETYRLEGDDATYIYRLRATRVTPGATDRLQLKLSGDTPVDGASLQAEARDTITNASLPIGFIRDDPYFKVVEIAFNPNIEEGHSFAIWLSFRWSGTFPRARRNDYTFSSWNDFAPQGVDRLISCVSSDVDIRVAKLFEVSEGRRQLATVQPKTVPTGTRWEVRWTVDKPHALYLLSFEKAVP